jgi:hypothetical protein
MLNILTEKQVEEVVDSKPVGSAGEIKRMQAWLDERISKGKKTPFSEVVMLTPVLASLLLKRNENNRNLRRSNSESIRDDILSGRWHFNGESIVVSDTGVLLDGQHRCSAVMLTGHGIQVSLVFGAKEESRFTIDIGSPKSAANFLHMKGYKDTNNLAAMIGLVVQYQKMGDIPRGYTRPTKTEVVQSADEMRGVQASLDFVSSCRVLGSRSIMGFVHYVLKKRAGVVAADEFVSKLIDGSGLRKGDPIYHCRERLIAMRAYRADASERIKLIFRAWNHWRQNETIAKLIVPTNMPKLER